MLFYIIKIENSYNNNNNNNKEIDSNKYTRVFDTWIIDRGIKIDEASHKLKNK